jgi:hypothetical protein
MSDHKINNDWPIAAVIIAVLGFIAYLTTHGHPEALFALIIIVLLVLV